MAKPKRVYGFPAEDYDLNDLYNKRESTLQRMAEEDPNVEYVDSLEDFVRKTNANEIDDVNRVWVFAGMKRTTIYL